MEYASLETVEVAGPDDHSRKYSDQAHGEAFRVGLAAPHIGNGNSGDKHGRRGTLFHGIKAIARHLHFLATMTLLSQAQLAPLRDAETDNCESIDVPRRKRSGEGVF